MFTLFGKVCLILLQGNIVLLTIYTEGYLAVIEMEDAASVWTNVYSKWIYRQFFEFEFYFKSELSEITKSVFLKNIN